MKEISACLTIVQKDGSKANICNDRLQGLSESLSSGVIRNFYNECETNFLSNVPMLYVFFKVYCEAEPKRYVLAHANAELAAAT